MCEDNTLKIYKPFKENVKEDWKNIYNYLNIKNYQVAFVCSFGYMVPSHFIDKINKGKF